jgi:hypothetical protein
VSLIVLSSSRRTFELTIFRTSTESTTTAELGSEEHTGQDTPIDAQPVVFGPPEPFNWADDVEEYFQAAINPTVLRVYESVTTDSE